MRRPLVGTANEGCWVSHSRGWCFAEPGLGSRLHMLAQGLSACARLLKLRLRCACEVTPGDTIDPAPASRLVWGHTIALSSFSPTTVCCDLSPTVCRHIDSVRAHLSRRKHSGSGFAPLYLLTASRCVQCVHTTQIGSPFWDQSLHETLRLMVNGLLLGCVCGMCCIIMRRQRQIVS